MPLKKEPLDRVKKLIQLSSPRLVFVTGKACSGKSTFAHRLEKYGYKHLSFDHFVYDSVIKKFKVTDPGLAFGVYRGVAPASWQKSFETEAHKLIFHNLQTSKVVVDAAIGDSSVLKNIFSGKLSNFTFIYLHPFDRDYYRRSMFKRFREDVKKKQASCYLWDFVTPQILADFKKYGSKSQLAHRLVNTYADESIRRSRERLRMFRRSYPNLIITGH